MVHVDNVEGILQNGMCCAGHLSADPNYVNIGMAGLIANRHDHPISLPEAGNFGEYIPFYFGGHSPMLYLINNGYSGVEQRAQKDIVFLVSNVNKVQELNLEFVFTDRHAKNNLATFYRDTAHFNQVNWAIVNSRNWANDEVNIARRDIKQAEFMIRNHVPINCVTSIVVKSADRKAQIDTMIANLGLELEVHIDINCNLYY